MPRSAGTYTLPAGNPVVTGTSISSTVQNNTMTDMANELTNSIPRDGQAPPTANLPMGGFKLTGLAAGTTAGDSVRFEQLTTAVASMADGTVGAPGLPFTNDGDTGFYRIGANNLGVAASGAKVVDIATTGMTIVGTFGASGNIDGAKTIRTTGSTVPSSGSGLEFSYDGTYGRIVAYNRTGAAALPIIIGSANELQVAVTANTVGVANLDVLATGVIKNSGTQVLSTRKTGWTAATGTATRTTFATSTVTTAQLAERLKALLDDLISHGVIGT